MSPNVRKEDVCRGYSSTGEVEDSLVETPIANARFTKARSTISKPTKRRRSHRINFRRLIFEFSSLNDTSPDTYQRTQDTGVGDFDISAFEKRVKKRLQCGLSTVPPPRHAFRIVKSEANSRCESKSEIRIKGSEEMRHLERTSNVLKRNVRRSKVNHMVLGRTHQQSGVNKVIFGQTGVDGEFIRESVDRC